jgi:predicted MFS family arabinose efflux permease
MTSEPPSPASLQRLQRNPVLLCAFHAGNMALFPIAVLTLFLRDELGLGLFHVFLLQAIFACAVAVLEFPSGYLADRWGYRRVLLVATVFAVLGWLGYAFAFDFATLVAGELLLAVAVSLISGADSALLYETLLALRDEASFPRWFGRYRAIGNVAEGTAALAGAYLFVRSPRAPFAIQVALTAINLALSHALCEPPRDRGQDLPAFERVRGLVRYVALGPPRLRAVVALVVALSLPSYVMVWVLPAYVADAGINPAFMGPIWAAASYTVALASWSSPRLAQCIGTLRTLGSCVMLVAAGYLGLGLTHAAYGFLFYFALCTVRGLQLPLLHTEEQRLVPSSDRAALLSLNSLVFRAAFVLLGPVIGYALDHADTHRVLIGVGMTLTLAAGTAWTRLASTERQAYV